METRRTSSQTKAAQVPDEAATIEAQELSGENKRVLRESQQGIGIGSYVIDLATGTWKVSPELYKIFGIDETRLHTLEGWVGLLHPDSREKCTEYHSQVESEKTRFDYEYRITRINDGAERWVHGLGEIEYDNQKTPVRRLGIIQDITERKQAEEQLWLTQVTMDHLSEAIFWVDPTARFLYVNDAACRLLGYSKEELLSLSVPDINPNFPVEAWPAHWASLKQRESFTFESTQRTKEGAILQTEVTMNYLQVDGKEYNCAIMRDITERKRAEEALRESEVRYRLLTEATFDGIAIHDQGIMIEVNSGLEKMFGYGPGELIGKHVLDLVADESREMAMANMRQGVSGPYESVGRRKDGSTFYGEVVVKSHRYWGREVRLVAGRDITERKRVEEESQERAEETLRLQIALLDLARLDDTDLAFDEIVPHVTKIVAETLGVERVSVWLLSTDQTELVCENLYERSRAVHSAGNRLTMSHYPCYSAALMDGLIVAANDARSDPRTSEFADGYLLPLGITSMMDVSIRRQGQLIGVVCCEHVGLRREWSQEVQGFAIAVGQTVVRMKESAERERAEGRLRRTQYAVDQATDYIFVIGHDGYFLDVNESACRRLGYTKQELLTKSVMDIDPDFPPAVWTTFWDEFKQSKLLRFETRHRSKSGEIYPVEVVANYILHEGRELDYAFVRDITERKKSEAALQVFQDQIRQMQKMEAIGQMAGGIAHDFNNILTAILGNAKMACTKVASDHPSQSNLRRIIEAGDRASHLVQQILTYSHKQAFSRTVLALSPVVNEALVLLRATFPGGIELSTTDDVATPHVLADATRIHQIVMNLCTNAWHALKEQPGQIDLPPVVVPHPLLV
jgi:PAS domain S-box-containing protein